VLRLIWLIVFYAPTFVAVPMVLEVLANDASRCFCTIRVASELCVGVVPSHTATTSDDNYQNQSSDSMNYNLLAFLTCPHAVCSSSKEVLEIGYKYLLSSHINIFLQF
jgi:hypothetical protein